MQSWFLASFIYISNIETNLQGSPTAHWNKKKKEEKNYIYLFSTQLMNVNTNNI